MAMVSDFLGQLSLNIGVMSCFFFLIQYTGYTGYFVYYEALIFICLSFALNPQNNEPTYPTVVPVVDFDPDRDAARIETAIKTKGKILCVLLKNQCLVLQFSL